jgi:hypothetical protein
MHPCVSEGVVVAVASVVARVLVTVQGGQVAQVAPGVLIFGSVPVELLLVLGQLLQPVQIRRQEVLVVVLLAQIIVVNHPARGPS